MDNYLFFISRGCGGFFVIGAKQSQPWMTVPCHHGQHCQRLLKD